MVLFFIINNKSVPVLRSIRRYQVGTHINGSSLEPFEEDAESIELFITFNGIACDIPIIENDFRIKRGQPQVESGSVLSGLGIPGRLMHREKTLGVSLCTLEGIDGRFALLLWRAYERTGNRQAPETLLARTIQNTVNLERPMVETCNRTLGKIPFHDHPGPMRVDTIKRQKRYVSLLY